MNIEGVPESIEWPTVAAFIESLGIDLNHVPQDVGITIGWDAIETTVLATDTDGGHYLDATGDDVAKHRISIRVNHPELLAKSEASAA